MRTNLVLAALVCLTTAVSAADAGNALVGRDATLQVSVDGRDLCTLAAGLFDSNWSLHGATAPGGDPAGDTRTFNLQAGPTRLAGAAVFTQDADAVGVTYRFTAEADVTLNSLHVSADFAASTLAGGTWSVDGKNGAMPKEFGEQSVFGTTMKELTLTAADGRRLSVTFAEATWVMLQDNRKWGPSFSLRIGAKAQLKRGEHTGFAMKLGSTGRIALGFDRPVTITAGDDWLPLALDLEIEPGSVLDFSQQGFTDAPAGKHGRVIARADGQFAFAKKPDTIQRFYGVNLCFGSQFLAHADADRLAERLVRLGYNAVRIHHYEGELLNWKAGGDWDAAKLDQFDYLLTALAKRGIYLTTDLFVSRPVSAASIGLDAKRTVGMNTYKILVPVHDGAWKDWQAFARKLLDHVNPYSKTRYADDPALAWIAMINEGNFENYYGEIRALPEWSTAFNRWLAKHYSDRAGLAKAWVDELAANEDPAAGSVKLPQDLGGKQVRVRDTLLFLNLTEKDMYERMTAFLHQDIGCHALFTNTSAWTNRVTGQLTRSVYDYVDDHFYIDHPEFIEKEWQLPSRCGNRNPLSEGATGGRSCNFVRLWDKPFTITEFNYSGPGRYRGVGGILTGAMGALQGWSGIWRFAYSHGAKEELEPGRMDYFNLASDPLNQAADRAAITLFLRGDLAPAPHRVTISMTAEELAAPPRSIPHLTPNWNWLTWITGVGTRVIEEKSPALANQIAEFPLGWAKPSPTGMDPYAQDRSALLAMMRSTGVIAANALTDPDKNIFASETGELLLDAAHGQMTFDTPRTAGGYAEAGQTIAATRASVTVRDLSQGATVFVTTVDGQPIATSKRLLVTHLTDLQNTGARFAETARRTLLDWGHLPHLVARGSATIGIRRPDAAGLKAWALSTAGKRLEEVPLVITPNGLTLTVDVKGRDGARLLYEISRP